VLGSVDDVVVTWLNQLVRRHPTAAALIGILAERLATLEIVLMLLLALSGRGWSALRMLVAVAAVYTASELLGLAWPRPRPFARLDNIRELVRHEPRRSFPSRHVASGVAMAMIGGREHPRLGWLMADVAVLLGLSRVAAGLHYPSDVAAGAALGIGIGRCIQKA
jgi:membrane-associated phospholipid phosphatase